MKRAFALALGALLCAATTAIRADADGSGGGGLGDGSLTVSLVVSLTGQPGIDAHDPNAPSPYHVVATPSYDRTSPLAGLCSPGSGPPPPWGWVWWIQVVDSTTGAIVSEQPQCVALTAGVAAPGPAPQLPQPPTIGEIWAHAELPTPSLALSPAREGITGLPTWMWATSPAQISVDVTLNGYRVLGTAQRTGFAFAAGEGEALHTVHGGSRAAPALSHVYETKGLYRAIVGTMWSATVTMTGPGLSSRPTPIGQALITGTIGYPVVEVRGALTG